MRSTTKDTKIVQTELDNSIIDNMPNSLDSIEIMLFRELRIDSKQTIRRVYKRILIKKIKAIKQKHSSSGEDIYIPASIYAKEFLSIKLNAKISNELKKIINEVDAAEFYNDKQLTEYFSGARKEISSLPAYNTIKEKLKNLEKQGFLDSTTNGKNSYYFTAEFNTIWTTQRNELIKKINEIQDKENISFLKAAKKLKVMQNDFFFYCLDQGV